MALQRVGLLGASGETGASILEGLIEDGGFTVIALARPSSLSKPANVALKERGVQLRSLDLTGPEDAIAAALSDIDILISAIGPREQLAQLPLVSAAQRAGIKRFVPCAFMPITPVGAHQSRDQKEQVYNLTKRLHVPYTVIDVGWWYQIAFPELPSGRIDYAVGFPGLRIPGDGNVLTALTDLRDVGRYVARIIKDERTLNAMVFVHNEMWTWSRVYDLLEKLSGETVPREYVSADELQRQLAAADAKLRVNRADPLAVILKVGVQYMLSWGIRGENSPEFARYLGYLDGKKLYPDFNFTPFEEYLQEVISGKAQGVHSEDKSLIREAFRQGRQWLTEESGN